MHTAVRLGLLAICLLAAVGLVVHHGATYDENWSHPTGDQPRGTSRPTPANASSSSAKSTRSRTTH
ncbi:hypothetical protein ACFQMM_09350 [Saliphagus sp. GCM10025308]